MTVLLDHVLAQQDCLESLIAALEEENDALSCGRFADLPALAERKNALLSRVAEIESDREAAQAQLGLPSGRSGVEMAASTEVALSSAWANLLKQAARAREQNQMVGAKVFTQLEFASNALAFLQTRGQPLYGPDGARRGPPASATIAIG